MLHGSLHPGVAGSELTRLLATLTDAPPPEGRPAFAERLGQWLGWTDAIALSHALTAAPSSSATSVRWEDVTRATAEFERVRATLEAAITHALRDMADEGGTDFAPYRRHCSALQQTLHDAVATLRRRLRETLSRHSPALAQLAALDAAMDTVLAAQERTLLGLVPLRLQAHFDRLQRAAAEGDTTWLSAWRADAAELLRAELAHRLLPAWGLLEALRTSSAS